MGQTIKVSTKVEVVILPFHRDAYGIAQTGHRAAETMLKKMSALLVSRYGQPVIGKDAEGKETRSGGPTFEQYRADQSALAAIAKERKLADNQWVRKPYAAAVKALYGALPVSQDAAAVAKRAQREAAEALKAAAKGQEPAATAGAEKGQPTDRQPSPEETAEQIVARIGVFKALDACIRILESDDSTKAQAMHLRKMADKAAKDAAKVSAPKEPATV